MAATVNTETGLPTKPHYEWRGEDRMSHVVPE
jgi:hypothetical protein